jgi:hypothetical protein
VRISNERDEHTEECADCGCEVDALCDECACCLDCCECDGGALFDADELGLDPEDDHATT